MYYLTRRVVHFFISISKVILNFLTTCMRSVGRASERKRKTYNKKRVSTLYPNFASYCFTIPIIILTQLSEIIIQTMQIKYITSLFHISISFIILIQHLQSDRNSLIWFIRRALTLRTL